MLYVSMFILFSTSVIGIFSLSSYIADMLYKADCDVTITVDVRKTTNLEYTLRTLRHRNPDAKINIYGIVDDEKEKIYSILAGQ